MAAKTAAVRAASGAGGAVRASAALAAEGVDAAARAPYKVLFVGAGLAAASAIAHLREAKRAPTVGARVDVTVVERNAVVGGRCSTCAPPAAAHGAPPVDLGLQYVTAHAFDEHRDVYDALVGDGVLEPWVGSITHQHASQRDVRNFSAPGGARSIVEHLLGDTTVHSSTDITRLEVARASGGSATWSTGLDRDDGLRTDKFDAVVLTAIAPQLMSRMEGDAAAAIARNEALAAGLASVKYSSRYAMALYWRPGSSADAARAALAASSGLAPPSVSWYVSPDEDDVVRYLAVDRRSACAAAAGSAAQATEGLSLLVHTSGPYGASHAADGGAEQEREVLADLERSLHSLLPALPNADAQVLHRWDHSQVLAPFGDLGAAALVPGTGSGDPSSAAGAPPALILAGDSLSGSGFDNVVRSGKAAAQLVLQQAALAARGAGAAAAAAPPAP